ncbi:MAG: hypothetical protein L0958_04380 [Candidatus Mariimomonas ferrooxydans]
MLHFCHAGSCPPQADESGILLGKKILEASLRVESLRPGKPVCRQAGGNDTTCAIIYDAVYVYNNG